ncbi:SCP2 sterol-binding domain-containing protein [Virgibacillus dokdonensis]|uniref:SCP-2 sterol transfer family protein n=2 Tax=Bacillaceae TaxID=186817 RepID=A0A2K9IV99_9BACI|nr:SCP-2 sterol transfer family protein [Virgibacillus dokdonensis]
MKEEHFLQLATGELTGTKALFTGKLKMEGNVKLALKLEHILSAYNQHKTV